MNVQENQKVKQGEILIVLENEVLNEQIQQIKRKQLHHQELLHDLDLLLHPPSAKQTLPLSSSFYLQSFRSFQQQVAQQQLKIDLLEKKYTRLKLLLKNKNIALQEFEPTEQEYKLAQTEMHSLIEKQHNQYEQDLLSYQREYAEFLSQEEQYEKQNKQYEYLAPFSGTIQNYSGLQQYNYINAGQEFAELTPDSGLLIETYVQPSDIGFIKQNMPVIFQVDAFPYNQWGMLKGNIKSISEDVIYTSQNNSPLFKVRCSFDSPFLTLKNGRRAYIGKGMTLQARFVVTQRTLWQLLYDKMDQWLNPAIP